MLYKDSNGFYQSSSTMDYDPSILIVSQQSVWPKSESINYNYNSQPNTRVSASVKDPHPSSEPVPVSGVPASHYNGRYQRTLPNDRPSHVHCSIQGHTISSKSSYTHSQPSESSRTSASRGESPMVVVQVTDG